MDTIFLIFKHKDVLTSTSPPHVAVHSSFFFISDEPSPINTSAVSAGDL